MTPRIGITTGTEASLSASGRRLIVSNTVPAAYIEAIAAAGGLPLLIPASVPPQKAEEYLPLLDGLLLTGGEDIDPSYYGEEPEKELGVVDVERDRMEWELTRLALQWNLPILGICRGIQVLNVAAGGTLWQDIARRSEFHVKHRQQAAGDWATHTLRVESGSLLARIFGTTQVRTNTFHHQAVKEVAPGFRAVAWSADGLIEGIEKEGEVFVVGVQYHPELMWRSHEPSRCLFRAFVEAAHRRS